MSVTEQKEYQSLLVRDGEIASTRSNDNVGWAAQKSRVDKTNKAESWPELAWQGSASMQCIVIDGLKKNRKGKRPTRERHNQVSGQQRALSSSGAKRCASR